MHEDPSEPILFRVGDEDAQLITPPFAVSDACRRCRSVNYEADHETCENCRLNESQLGGYSAPVEPVTLYKKPSRLRDWLTFYKSEDERLEDPHAIRAISHILDRFILENDDWITALSPSYAVVVPSTRRPPPHPLQTILNRGASGLEARPVVQRTSAELGFRFASRGAYVATQSVRGDRILLLDDVYTSGARAQSAAFALQASGAEVVSIAVLGRRINPYYRPRAADIFAEQQAKTFEWSLTRRHLLEHGSTQDL